jgi:hypothetical protein
MATNAEIEMRWIDAWNDLYDITGNSPIFPCMLDDYTVIDVDTLKGWLQDSVYDGWLIKVEAKMIHGKTVAFGSRWKEIDEDPDNVN